MTEIMNIDSFDDVNINSFDEFKMHPIYNKIINDYPILNKYSSCLNINDNVDIKLNFYNKHISNTLSKHTLINLLRWLIDSVHPSSKHDKVIIALLIFEIVLNHENFLLDNKKFLFVCMKKAEQFKNENYNDINNYMIYNNNINPIDTILEKFNKLNNQVNTENNINAEETKDATNMNTTKTEETNMNMSKTEETKDAKDDINILRDIPAEILSKYKLIYNSEVNNKIEKLKLKLNNDCNFNFKTNHNTLNEEDFNLSFSMYLDILSSSTTNHSIVITYTLIFELFINNIDFIKKDQLLKTFLVNKTKELIKTNFKDFENIKKNNYNKNPLETVVNLIKFYC